MSKSVAFFVLLLAIVAGLIATTMVMRYIKQQQKPAQVKAETAPVVVVKAQIPAGTSIRSEQIAVAQRPPKTIPQGAIKSATDVIGRVVRTTVYPGEVLMQNRLAASGGLGGLPALIPRGYRAITLRVDDRQSVAGFIRPGHCVDVLTTLDLPNSSRDIMTKVILQNIRVIATGQEIEETEESEEGEKKKAKKVRVVPTVTVIVTLEQAESLTLASSAGVIRLVLRSHTDRIEEKTAGVTLSSLIPQAEKDLEEETPVVVALPAFSEPTPVPVRTVEVYRGTEKTDVTFKY